MLCFASTLSKAKTEKTWKKIERAIRYLNILSKEEHEQECKMLQLHLLIHLFQASIDKAMRKVVNLSLSAFYVLMYPVSFRMSHQQSIIQCELLCFNIDERTRLRERWWLCHVLSCNEDLWIHLDKIWRWPLRSSSPTCFLTVVKFCGALFSFRDCWIIRANTFQVIHLYISHPLMEKSSRSRVCNCSLYHCISTIWFILPKRVSVFFIVGRLHLHYVNDISHHVLLSSFFNHYYFR